MSESGRYKWLDPLQVAANLNAKTHKFWGFLYSGLIKQGHSKYSILGFNLKEKIFGNNFDDLRKVYNISAKANCELQDIIKIFSESWFGYISYELAGGLTKKKKSFIEVPGFLFVKFSSIILFDHEKQEILYFQNKNEVTDLLNKIRKISYRADDYIKAASLCSNFTDDEYKKSIERIIKKITSGEFCEANLTRKFWGRLLPKSKFPTFYNLCQKYKVAYSAFFVLDKTTILSLSPEQFITTTGKYVQMTPIKGTVPVGMNGEENKKLAIMLKNSKKNRAENLMIVDLIRNDLAKNCETGSIKVPELFSTEIYNNVIHMHSKIIGMISKNKTNLDVIIDSFPPGSMTGAPKVKVIEECRLIERMSRGIYSGILGYYHPAKTDFSVVIRSLIMQNNKFEFQVGGAIVADSNPEEELQETYAKAKPFEIMLGLKNVKF